MLVYLNRRLAQRMLEGVRGAELRRVQLERQLVESRLATAEAQIDPQMLFSALADIRLGLERASPDADAKLDGLVQRLRLALAGTVVAVASAEGRP
jgi:sensor histidine kinase YesM